MKNGGILSTLRIDVVPLAVDVDESSGDRIRACHGAVVFSHGWNRGCDCDIAASVRAAARAALRGRLEHDWRKRFQN